MLRFILFPCSVNHIETSLRYSTSTRSCCWKMPLISNAQQQSSQGRQHIWPDHHNEKSNDIGTCQNHQSFRCRHQIPKRMNKSVPTIRWWWFLAPSLFCYEHLNRAFRILLEHPDNLITVHWSNYLRDANDGGLTQPLVRCLCDGAGKRIGLFPFEGKPSPEIFYIALDSMNHKLDRDLERDRDRDRSWLPRKKNNSGPRIRRTTKQRGFALFISRQCSAVQCNHGGRNL